jgi:hypothetical protein
VPSSGARELMLSLGLPSDHVTLTPYSVDNDWWIQKSAKVDRASVRAGWGASSADIVILFCAKLQPWKRPLDLLRAFAKAQVSKALLVFAGEGPLRSQLESESIALGVASRVRFLGFANQTQLPAIYTKCRPAIQEALERNGGWLLAATRIHQPQRALADGAIKRRRTPELGWVIGVGCQPRAACAATLEPMAPHPLGEVRFEGTPAVLVGQESEGYKLALSTLEVFRPSVGAAACGLAARALEEAVRWAQARRQFGRALADFQATQMALAEMHVDLEAARLLVRRAAWLKDRGAERIGPEGAAAKLFATEAAQRVVDRAVQIHGGQGVMRGATVERLYREVRALRIYEGTSEIQKLVIAREILKEKR